MVRGEPLAGSVRGVDHALKPPPDAAREALEGEGRRIVDRLRTIPLTRLAAPAQAARVFAAALAAAAPGIEHRDAAEPPLGRALPVLVDAATADLVAVLLHDVLAASDGVEPEAPVWTADGRRSALGDELSALARSATELRRSW